MPDLPVIATLLGAILFGVLCTLLVQCGIAVRTLTQEVSQASRRVGELMELLQPTARRLSRVSGMVEESEPDLRRMQLALGRFSDSSVQMSDSLARVSSWMGIAAPLIISAVERWSARDEGHTAQHRRAASAAAEPRPAAHEPSPRAAKAAGGRGAETVPEPAAVP